MQTPFVCRCNRQCQFTKSTRPFRLYARDTSANHKLRAMPQRRQWPESARVLGVWWLLLMSRISIRINGATRGATVRLQPQMSWPEFLEIAKEKLLSTEDQGPCSPHVASGSRLRKPK